MPSVRNLLSSIVLVGLCAVSITAGVEAVWSRSGPGQPLGHDELFDYLANRDLSRELSAAKLRLSRQFVEELRQGNDWRQERNALSPRQRARWKDNLRELAATWLLDRADRFAALPEAERGSFLDVQLDDVANWPVWANKSDSAVQAALHTNPTAALNEVNELTRRFDAAQQQRVQQFIAAIYLRWLQRGFGQFLPFGR